MVLFAAVTVPFAPWTSDPVKYFRGGFVSDTKKDASNWILLASSAFVSWIFAKGILNTSTLGASFGVVGGLAYAAWVSDDHMSSSNDSRVVAADARQHTL
jgi:hypothetical protein